MGFRRSASRLRISYAFPWLRSRNGRETVVVEANEYSDGYIPLNNFALLNFL